MNNLVFEVIDKTERKIHLTKERWKHITTKHPYMANFLNEVEETTRNSDRIVSHNVGGL